MTTSSDREAARRIMHLWTDRNHAFDIESMAEIIASVSGPLRTLIRELEPYVTSHQLQGEGGIKCHEPGECLKCRAEAVNRG